MKTPIGLALSLALCSSGAFAADYVIDGADAGRHSSVHFKASHVGISSLYGRFNDITGSFTYDQDNMEDARIEVVIDTASLDTNHEARDEHLRTSDYLHVEEYPEARFVSTSIEQTGEGRYQVSGDFSLHGQTHEISFDMHRTGEGDTPFGDYRVGFEGEARIDAADYGIGIIPDSTVDLTLAIEGVRQ